MNDEMDILKLILGAILWFLFWLAPLCALLFTGYVCFSLPLKRQERARFFLDLLDTALREGKRVENVLISISESRDRSMGVRFHLLAAYLETGMRLGEALDKVPRLLPTQISTMLKVGGQIGDIGKMLPACRQLLKDAQSQTQGAINYLVLLAFVITPMGISIFGVLETFVMPQFEGVAVSMGAQNSHSIAFLVVHKTLLISIQILLLAVVWSVAFCYIGGPRLTTWTKSGAAGIIDRLFYALPWRRKRMERDFSAMLAVLLDSGTPEPEALRLAANCTANGVFQTKTGLAVAALQQGTTLPEAVQNLDQSGEFGWRLSHAMRTRGGFLKAVLGWNESLDAKAFQQEQATAQVISTGLLLANALLVGFVMVSVFGVLISIIRMELLW
ncbi:type II secretion system F family protein [Pedosphaera parvula]|uniref:Type II secretory pathway component PulF-like protein n=1 Tax=Pedosphaera parvula (strain Ellin514) TaxID=320771 RepID=B9XSX5_PEDPL|nr:type II secretion system F family protein [Pedosphaera parvula]EEF57059.1 Type II secretory pathway component PulF-like protein [Pedosphaera parvula Ellin514]